MRRAVRDEVVCPVDVDLGHARPPDSSANVAPAMCRALRFSRAFDTAGEFKSEPNTASSATIKPEIGPGSRCLGAQSAARGHAVWSVPNSPAVSGMRQSPSAMARFAQDHALFVTESGARLQVCRLYPFCHRYPFMMGPGAPGLDRAPDAPRSSYPPLALRRRRGRLGIRPAG